MVKGTASKTTKGAYVEVVGDLFTTTIPNLAHCVSECLAMSKGIAVPFKEKYGRVDELKAQKVKPGGVAVLYTDTGAIYYLVTKERYWHKPTKDNMRKSLVALKDLMLENKHYELAIPLIGCGLDRLKWDYVSKLVKEILVNNGISVTVYRLE